MTNAPHNLERFIQAQQQVYVTVLSELNRGHKSTHWMWFIFPQIKGLGSSALTNFYAIKSLDEASCYLNHPLLGARLLECSEIILGFKDRSIGDIFAYPDDLKLLSCMTLFSKVAESRSVFDALIEQCFAGQPDARTLELIDVL